MKKALRIDSNRFFVEDVILQDDEATPPDCIETPCPDGFYKPKWDGTQWIEGGSAPVETDEQKKLRYDALTVQYIRQQYTADDEYQILREKLAGTDVGAFDTYNAFVEQCKVNAHTVVYGN